MCRVLAIAIVTGLTVAALSGCGGDPAPFYAQAFGYHCDRHDSATAKALCRKNGDPGTAQVSRYCYNSIGNTNCFDRPDPNSNNQPLGSPGG